MDIIKTGIGIGKTIRNVSRLREILNTFATNGFDEFIIKTNLHTKIPGFVIPKERIKRAITEIDSEEETDIWRSLGYRARKSFEVLGPSFIKLGQLLSTREDLFGPAFIEEMKLLQNKVEVIPFNVIKPIIEEELGKKIEDVFSEFNEVPIGTASIGTVYRGKLKTGEDVVVKVRKPNIETLIDTDFEILKFITIQAEKVSDEIKYMGVSRMLDDFEKTIKLELNFRIEAMNCEKLDQNLKAIDKDEIIRIPKTYGEYSTEKLMIMEFFHGKPFNELKPEDLDAAVSKKMEKSVHLFLHTLLADGFFHADLHGGNFFLLDDGKIGIIDFGLMGVLSKKNRDNLVAILFALGSNNYENLVYELLDVADYDIIPNDQELIRDVKDCLRPFIGLSIQETNVTELVRGIIQALSKHQIYLPREWFVIFRALMTLDGVGKSIGIDLNIFNIIDSDLKKIMNEVMSKEAMMEDLMWVGRDVVNSVRYVPRHLRWFLKEVSKNGYAFEHQIKDLDQYSRRFNDGIYYMGLIFLAGVFTVCGTIFILDIKDLHWQNIPIVTYVFWILSIVMFLRANISFKKR